MAEKRWQAHARVQVTVEIVVPDVWGEDCSMGQVKKQAIESVRSALMRGLSIS